jgi:hypothetical protein
VLGLEVFVMVDELAQAFCHHLSIAFVHTTIEVEPEIQVFV